MAEQHPHMRPTSKDLAPDPASSYERARPEKEAGMGRLDNNVATPADAPDQSEQAVENKQPLRQLNAEDVVSGRARRPADGAAVTLAPGQAPARSIHANEQPAGSDQAPSETRNPRDKWRPKNKGKGGSR